MLGVREVLAHSLLQNFGQAQVSDLEVNAHHTSQMYEQHMHVLPQVENAEQGQARGSLALMSNLSPSGL